MLIGSNVNLQVTSPPLNDRSTKRLRHSDSADMTTSPENVIEIVPDGDALVIVTGMSSAPETSIGLSVSQYALSMASPVLKAAFASAAAHKPAETDDLNRCIKVVPLPEDNGDAMFILVNILHLRNDKLPTRILPDMLCKLACLAQKYRCVVAARPPTLEWFDRLYAGQSPGDTWRIIEAASLLDEATYFARFTGRWVLEKSLHFRQVPFATTAETQKLARKC